MQASAQADERRGDLELTEASLARIPKHEQQPAAPDMSAERSNRVAAFQSALSTRVPVDKVMRELTYVVPEDVWLNGLTVIIPTETGPAAGAADARLGDGDAGYGHGQGSHVLAGVDRTVHRETLRVGVARERPAHRECSRRASGGRSRGIGRENEEAVEEEEAEGRRDVHGDGRPRPGSDVVSIGSLTGSRRALVAVVGVAVVLYLLAVWFLFLSPRRAEAARLQAEVTAAEAQLADARGGAGVTHVAKTHVSDLFRLAKAMPSSRDQASLLLELDLLARKANVTIASVSMQEPSALPGGSTAIPVAVTVSGTYRNITRFVRHVCGTLARVCAEATRMPTGTGS